MESFARKQSKVPESSFDRIPSGANEIILSIIISAITGIYVPAESAWRFPIDGQETIVPGMVTNASKIYRAIHFVCRRFNDVLKSAERFNLAFKFATLKTVKKNVNLPNIDEYEGVLNTSKLTIAPFNVPVDFQFTTNSVIAHVDQLVTPSGELVECTYYNNRFVFSKNRITVYGIKDPHRKHILTFGNTVEVISAESTGVGYYRANCTYNKTNTETKITFNTTSFRWTLERSSARTTFVLTVNDRIVRNYIAYLTYRPKFSLRENHFIHHYNDPRMLDHTDKSYVTRRLNGSREIEVIKNDGVYHYDNDDTLIFKEEFSEVSGAYYSEVLGIQVDIKKLWKD